MYITFTEGWYNIKGQPTNVGGMTFKLVEDYKVAKSGEGYVTVEGGSQPGFPDRSIRIKCRQGAYNVVRQFQTHSTRSSNADSAEEQER